jgi:poly-gamma-glutamate synthase PgsB/CapB
MSTSAPEAMLTAQISEHLPKLEQRVRANELAEVVRDALTHGDASPAGFLRLAAEYGSQTGDHHARLAKLRVEYAEAPSSKARIAVIQRALRQEQAPDRALAAAKRGWLDLDAMTERTELALHALIVRQSLALRAAAALVEGAAARPVAQSLLDYLLARPQPLVAVAAAEALAELHGRLPESRQREQALLDQERWLRLCGQLADGTAPRRVQAALLRLCLQVVPELARRPIGARLQRVGKGDDFLIRQHIVVLLGQRSRDAAAFALLCAKVRCTDASEHVRLALPAALRATGGAEAVPQLTLLSGSAARKGDRSPRVRAAAAIALASLLRAREANTSAELLYLLTDPDALVYRTVAQEVEDLALSNRLSEVEAREFAAAMAQRVAQTRNTSLANPALRAQEALATITNGELALARSFLEARLGDLQPGQAIEVQTPVAPSTLGRLLALLSRKGFGYYAEPITGGYRIERGARFVPQAWRMLHELRRRNPYKRQDALHTVGRQFVGTLRAHSGLLAEATSTAVPGEPLASPREGSWGPHLPTVDDLLSMPLLGATPVQLFSARGITRITPPDSVAGRVRAWVTLTARYAAVAEQRVRSLDPSDPAECKRFIETLESLGFHIVQEPYGTVGSANARAPRRPAPLQLRPVAAGAAAGAAPAALLMLGSPEALGDLVHYFMSPAENTLEQLGVAAFIACVAMLGANIARRQQVRRDRAKIPLVIGGWGTRGKSGTERLKAGLMHALDLDVLVKTTGCEAMFIHGVPGRKPSEIFIHRSYDKATIWEQRDLLSLAARLRVQVFLWECMALSSPLVRVLSDEWMADDMQTLTNAYPDHEDIQGPAGHDVARSIAGFIRHGGTTITTEDQMLPILEDEARHKGAELLAVPAREHELLAEDLLARFPYREHPSNIALVRQMAMKWGLDADLATADMADHVVPDLGVLKAYPAVSHRGRSLIFVNGMSANERTGFLSNWQRTGCERPVDQPGRWVVTVVNNRYDRVARSKVFAEVLVRDASAERHVLIGTNLSGLRVYIGDALTGFVRELHLFRNAPAAGSAGANHAAAGGRGESAAELRELVRLRCERMRHRLRIGPAEPQAVLTEVQGWLGGADVSSLAAAMASAAAAAAGWADEGLSLVDLQARLRELPLGSALAQLAGQRAAKHPESGDAGEAGQELIAYTCRSIARRALLASLQRAAERAIAETGQRAAVLARQERLYRELFMDLVVIIEDPGKSGDQIIDCIAASCPPGIEATVMGIQNIKGTGLDFVYRFLRYDEVHTLVEQLKTADADAARNLAAMLVARTDYGMLDSALAHKSVEQAAARFAGQPQVSAYLRDTAAQLAEIAARCQAALGTGKKQQRNPLVRAVERAFDTMDAVRRRWRSEAILDALVHHEISHERAALESRRLVEREKKGWLRKHA